MYSAVIWIHWIKEEIYNPTNGKERDSDLTRRTGNASVLYPCIPSQRIKIFCHILLWIRSRVSFLNIEFRESMRNWTISQFHGILLRSCTIGIWSKLSEVIKQLESKQLNILKTCLIYWWRKKKSVPLHYCIFFSSVTSKNIEFGSDIWKVSSTWQDQTTDLPNLCFPTVLSWGSHQRSVMLNDTRDWWLRSALLFFVQ